MKPLLKHFFKQLHHFITINFKMKKNILTILFIALAYIAQAQEEVFTVVEEMPRFPGCEEMDSTAEAKRICAEQELLRFIYSNIIYPDSARIKGTEGMVVVQFVVNSKGQVEKAKILRNIADGLGEEALRVVNLMVEQEIKWIPGKQKGENVSVMFNLPIRFKLEQEEEKGQNLFIHFVFCRDFSGEFFQKDFLVEIANQDFDGTDVCSEGIDIKSITVTYEKDDESTTVTGEEGWTQEVADIFKKAEIGGSFSMEYVLTNGDQDLKVLKVLIVE